MTTTTPKKKTGRPAIFTKEEAKNRKRERERARYHRLKSDPEWLERIRERRRLSSAKRRASKPKTVAIERRRTYLNHRSEHLEWQRRYRLEHREEINEKQRRYRAEHPEKIKAQRHAQRTRKRPMQRLDALKKATDQFQQETQRKVDELMRMFEQWEG